MRADYSHASRNHKQPPAYPVAAKQPNYVVTAVGFTHLHNVGKQRLYRNIIYRYITNILVVVYVDIQRFARYNSKGAIIIPLLKWGGAKMQIQEGRHSNRREWASRKSSAKTMHQQARPQRGRTH